MEDKTQPRFRVHLTPDHGSWKVTFPGAWNDLNSTHMFKYFALSYAARTCRNLHMDTGINISLYVHDKKGRFQEERSYGYDPEESKG